MVLLGEAQRFQMKVSTAKFSILFSHPTKPVYDQTAAIALLQTFFFLPELDTLFCARYLN